MLFFAGCSKKHDRSDENSLIKNWEYSVKTLDFDSFRRYEAFIGSFDQFQDMYRDFYFRNTVLLTVGAERDSVDYDGNPVLLKKIEFGGNVVRRNGDAGGGTYLGTAEVIKYKKEESASGGWRMSNTTIMRNEK
jgi:hypothetical protein